MKAKLEAINSLLRHVGLILVVEAAKDGGNEPTVFHLGTLAKWERRFDAKPIHPFVQRLQDAIDAGQMVGMNSEIERRKPLVRFDGESPYGSPCKERITFEIRRS